MCNIKRKNYKEIKKYCDKLNIEFMSTPYDLKSVELLENLKVRRYKVASADVVDMPLHKKIISTRKPVILSTGMATIPEIRKTVRFYKPSVRLHTSCRWTLCIVLLAIVPAHRTHRI